LDALAVQDDLEICEFRCSSPGCAAMLVRIDETGGGIFLAPGPSRGGGRWRFSVAHEMGHYHIPWHRTAGLKYTCADADLRAREADAKRLEWEANDFAAELLMPRQIFAGDARGKDISFTTVGSLAGRDMYAVSVTSAAWRLVQTSRDACALVVTCGGQVKWVARSKSFGLPLIERNQTVDPNSAVAATMRGEGSVASPRPVPWHAWFEPPTHAGELLESTHAIPSANQVLALLWFVEGDGSDDE